MSKRPLVLPRDCNAGAKRARPVVHYCVQETHFTDLPMELHERILDHLDGKDLYNAIVSCPSMASATTNGIYGSKRIFEKFGPEAAFVIGASRASIYRNSTGYGSILRTLADTYTCDALAVHPNSGK